MASYVTPKKGVEYIFYLGLVSQADTKVMQANPTIAAGDFKVSVDGGALANPATLPAVTPASSKMVKITLSTSEMNGDNVTLIASDAAGAEWCDAVVNIQTSARQIDDLAFPTISGRSLDVTATGAAGVDWGNVENPTTAVNLSGTNIDVDQVVASVSGAVGSVTGAVGSVTGAVGSVTGAVGSVTGNVGGNVVGTVASVVGAVGSVTGAVGSVTGAVGSVTGNVGGNVVGTVASVTGNVGGNVVGSVASVTADVGITQGGADKVWGSATRTLTSFGTLVADTAAAVWASGTRTITDLSAGLLALFFTRDTTSTYGAAVAGSVVKEIVDNAGGGTPPTAAAIADAVWDEALAGHVAAGSTGEALGAAGAAGDPWITALPGAYGAGSAGQIIGTLAQDTADQVWATGGRSQ